MASTIISSSSSSLSNNPNLFSSLPSKTPLKPKPSTSYPPPIPFPKYPPKQRHPPKQIQPPSQTTPPKKHPFSKIPHNNTKYFKPISTVPQTPTTSPNDRSVVLGPTGLSFLLPNAPFEFKFSYSETPKAAPLAIREPPFLPFAPPSMPRPWTGKAPLLSKKEKLLKKRKIPLFDTRDSREFYEGGKILELRKKNSEELFGGGFVRDSRSREEILGEELSSAEVKRFVNGFFRDNRQVNLGRDGLTHNMLELIHSHWKRQEVCKVKCKGVPTVDMDNVCRCIEEKTWGKIIHRAGGTIYLYRGRNYKYHLRPQFPVMLWKPATPVYPKLIQDAPEGLTKEEANVLRRKGKSLLAICKLAKNGMYDNLVNDVRQAFEGSILVKIDCRGLDPSDYKKIGAKLMELVPCVLLSFDDEQILMWRGREWKSMYPDKPIIFPSLTSSTYSDNSDERGSTNEVRSSPRMMLLWQRAIESNKAVVLDQTDLGPDALLEKVEEFNALTQAVEHSYPAILLSTEDRMSSSQSDGRVSENDEVFDNWPSDEEDDELELLEEVEPPGPLGTLPVDLIVSRLVNE